MAQNLSETFSLAETFQSSGHPEAAIETYLRVIYFDDEERYAGRALLNTAHLYYIIGDFRASALFYQRASVYYSGETTIRIYQQKVNALLSAKMYNSAIEDLLHFNISELNHNEHLRMYYLQFGTAYYGLGEYDKSMDYFLQLVDSTNQKQTESIKSIFASIKKKEKKNENVAFYLSAALPGLGQLYANDWRNGINSFLLSNGLLVLGIYSGVNYSWVNAFLIVGPWWSRYHIGGTNRAQESVKNYKTSQRHKHYNQLLELTGFQ